MRRRHYGSKTKGWYRIEPTKKTPQTQKPARGDQVTDPSEAPTRAGDSDDGWRDGTPKASRWWRRSPAQGLIKILRMFRRKAR